MVMFQQLIAAAGPRIAPTLDPDFLPAVLWDREFRRLVVSSGRPRPVRISLGRDSACVGSFNTVVFDSPSPEEAAVSLFHVERLVKSLLWICGGSSVRISGDSVLASGIARRYDSPFGERSFDARVMRDICETPFSVASAPPSSAFPVPVMSPRPLGRCFDGCRIGFDLGGTSCKVASLIDGKTVFTGEIPWSPYFEQNPLYHRRRISDILHSAASHLPRVDAIGGSCAGVMVNNLLRISSLFRGVPPDLFQDGVSGLFSALRQEWQVPFEVANDGEVAALAGAMELNSHSVLGVSMGTSMAGGYVDSCGGLTGWLNELAFVPVDYRTNAPVDEWSGDIGCGVQYFSQQAALRLAAASGLSFPDALTGPERQSRIRDLASGGDERALNIYRTMGVCFGYAVARYCDFYPELRKVLVLGGVSAGCAGRLIVEEASRVIRSEFPALALDFAVPGGQSPRFAQAVAAAGLPCLSVKQPISNTRSLQYV